MQISGLIVGLGNPGTKYDNTRHNLGFMAVDAVMDDTCRFSPDDCSPLSSDKKKCLLWKCFLGTPKQPWLIAKPQTYMNLSGRAIAPICKFYNISPEQLIVVHDELDIPLGRMKFKTGGGLAGHNGLKSIAQELGSKNFHRLRLGIGKPDFGDIANYVLAKFSSTEKKIVEQVLEASIGSILTFTAHGPQETVQKTNVFSALF